MTDQRAAGAVDQRLGERLRLRRLEIGMSQEKLGSILGITFQQVQKYEKGVNRISVSRLCDIAEALEMPVTRFFEGLSLAGRRVSKAELDLAKALLVPGATDIVLLYAALESGKLRKRVTDLVRTLIDGDA